MENIRRNDCVWTWMFTLREIKTFSQPSAYIRDIFTKLHRKNAFVFEQLSRATTQKKIFSIKICSKVQNNICLQCAEIYSAIFLLNFHILYLHLYILQYLYINYPRSLTFHFINYDIVSN